MERWEKIYINNNITNYSISSIGNVRNDRTYKNLSRCVHKGYFQVSLWVDGKKYTRYVHTLVASAFRYLIKTSLKMEINHDNGNKKDNRVENLYYCTHLENMRHASECGLIPNCENAPRGKYSNSTIIKICEELEKGTPYTQIAYNLKVPYSIISGIRTKKCWRHISKSYDFSKITRIFSKKPTSDLKIKIINLIKKGYVDSEIRDILRAESYSSVYDTIARIRCQIKEGSTTIP